MSDPAVTSLAPAVDEAGLRRFVDTEYPRVVAAVALITGDRPNAEDAVQEAMVSAWRRTDPIHNVGAWITVAATNRALSGLRSRGAEKRAATRLEQRLAAVPSAAAPEAAAARITMLEAVDLLPVRQRQAVILHYYLDQSVEQCAVAMDVSAGTIKTSLHRARSALGHLVGLPDDSAEGDQP